MGSDGFRSRLREPSSRILSHARIANAINVSVGFLSGLCTNTLASAKVTFAESQTCPNSFVHNPDKNPTLTLIALAMRACDKTLGVWVAEFKMTDDSEADVVDAVANGTFALAFKALNERFAA